MSYNVKGRDDQNYQMTYTRFEPVTSKPKSETTELSKDYWKLWSRGGEGRGGGGVAK